MNLRQNETKRIVHAPAKLNLFLDVFDRRADGFHDLETLMVPIRWFDSLALEPLPADAQRMGDIIFRLVVCQRAQGTGESCAGVPAGGDNLVVRALELLRQRSGCSSGARVELVKRIPSAAGLGGGSSDAAAALELANRAWGIHWPPERLAELAAELGSDVPFFLSHGPAVCRGRGECVERLPSVAPLHVVIVKPPAALATREVYDQLDVLPAGAPAQPTDGNLCRLSSLIRALRQGNLFGVDRWIYNRLQAAADALSPWIGRIRAEFAALDFLGHQLTGSGTAYFGICRHARHARRLASILMTRQLGLVYVTRSCR
jgi:4-diphosphocytidyl-2-C-methyl-D-erythritol kinase